MLLRYDTNNPINNILIHLLPIPLHTFCEHFCNYSNIHIDRILYLLNDQRVNKYWVMNERIKIITDRYLKCYQELIKARKRIKELENENTRTKTN